MALQRNTIPLPQGINYEKIDNTILIYWSENVEEIRELATLLESGISEYDDQLKILQSERLKYIRLSMTNGFGEEDGDSKDSWLLHLKQLEDSMALRLRALKQAIVDSALSFQQPEAAKQEDTEKSEAKK